MIPTVGPIVLLLKWTPRSMQCDALASDTWTMTLSLFGSLAFQLFGSLALLALLAQLVTYIAIFVSSN